MLDPQDDRWRSLKGGYRTLFDPRPLLLKLEAGKGVESVWDELWEGLHHQGDVGEASYATVPELVRIYLQNRCPDWNIFALVTCIELARTRKQNPPIPEWIENDYFESIEQLASIGLLEYGRTNDPGQIRAILSVLAINKGARVFGELLFNFEEKELLDFDLPLSVKS